MGKRLVNVSYVVGMPDGWELAEPEARCPNAGEYYLVCGTDVFQALGCVIGNYPIVRPAYPWSPCLSERVLFVAMDANGDMFAYTTRPYVEDCAWRTIHSYDCIWLNPKFFNVPAPCDRKDWKNSLRERPA